MDKYELINALTDEAANAESEEGRNKILEAVAELKCPSKPDLVKLVKTFLIMYESFGDIVNSAIDRSDEGEMFIDRMRKAANVPDIYCGELTKDYVERLYDNLLFYIIVDHFGSVTDFLDFIENDQIKDQNTEEEKCTE